MTFQLSLCFSWYVSLRLAAFLLVSRSSMLAFQAFNRRYALDAP